MELDFHGRFFVAQNYRQLIANLYTLLKAVQKGTQSGAHCSRYLRVKFYTLFKIQESENNTLFSGT